MEQAYKDLYREFLHLRSLCLKQAALLHHLTEALARQKAAAPASNRNTWTTGPSPNLLTEEKQGPSPEGCAQATGRVLPTAGQLKNCTFTAFPAGDSCTADDIAGRLNKLRLSPGEQREGKGAQTRKTATTGPLAPPCLNKDMAAPTGPEDTRRLEQQLRELFYKAVGGINDFDVADSTTKKRKLLWKFSSFLDSEMLSQAGGLMMSDVALQSQVCEFCHAVFPGNTTTQGDFLRHVTTHIN
ncbi:hypothetical protein GJAV_G00177920 [Gymnothorax javanicus]|nr:hypothetical protein GJAV_G00177920 [Gymnothorax javanicus]